MRDSTRHGTHGIASLAVDTRSPPRVSVSFAGGETLVAVVVLVVAFAVMTGALTRSAATRRRA